MLNSGCNTQKSNIERESMEKLMAYTNMSHREANNLLQDNSYKNISGYDMDSLFKSITQIDPTISTSPPQDVNTWYQIVVDRFMRILIESPKTR